MPGNTGPELQTLRDGQDRVLEREGIPMILALVSEVGAVPSAADQDVRAEGERLAGELDRYRDALIPGMRDGDNGCLISVLQAVSYTDFGGPAQSLPLDAVAAPRLEVEP